jgi:predicted PurR-regulated permease PerM
MATNVDIYLERLTTHESRISAIEEHQRIMVRREVIQFVVAVFVIVGSMFGAGGVLGWQNAQLIAQIDKRIDQIEKRIDQNERNFNARIDALEKSTNARIEALEKSTNARFDDLIARFEDLKQVVLLQRR